MNYTNCPYCSVKTEIYVDEITAEEDALHQYDCDNCGKTFVFYTILTYSFEPSKADCLNGSDHKYELTHTIPNEFSKMRCFSCDEERSLTDEERKKFKIGSTESYFESLNNTN